MAGLVALEVFSLVPELRESEHARNAYGGLAFHRDYGLKRWYG